MGVKFSVLTVYPLTDRESGIYTLPVQMTVFDDNGDKVRSYSYDSESGIFNTALTSENEDLWNKHAGVFFQLYLGLDQSIVDFEQQ